MVLTPTPSDLMERHTLQWQMVCGKEAYYLQSCLLYILMNFCNGWLTLEWDVTGKACLPAASAHALRRMLKVCSNFAMERNLMFNAGKTQLICFRHQRSIVVNDCIEFCGQKLNFFYVSHMYSDLSESPLLYLSYSK